MERIRLDLTRIGHSNTVRIEATLYLGPSHRPVYTDLSRVSMQSGNQLSPQAIEALIRAVVAVRWWDQPELPF